MPEQATTPTISTTATSDAQVILSAAERLSGALSLRKEQVTVLLSHCHELVNHIAGHEDVQHEAGEMSSTSGMVNLKSVCEVVKGVLDALTQKGFLWCIVNAEKIEKQVHDTIQEQMLGCYQSFQLDGAKFRSDLEDALKTDREDMARRLLYLSQDDDRLLQAIQDPDGVYRRTEELEVNIITHVENIPIRNDPTPEDRFLRAAEKMLRGRPGRKYDLKFPSYILSSLDVEHYPHQEIGKGASAEVYLGKFHGTSVAIKRIHPSEAKTISADMRRKIYHEISIWAELRHDNILPLYGACPDAVVPFLVMKYCPEGDVRNFLRNNPAADRFKLSYDVAVGLAFLHSKSIVHADIKGMNVLISGEHRALLTDFGLSIVMNEIRNLSTYSKDMQVKPRGTMAWMAPEVHCGSRPDRASDVYSLGMTIWEIYSGQGPFSGTVPAALAGVITGGVRPERPSGLYDDKVWSAVIQCWSKNPKSRPTADHAVNLLSSESISDSVLNNINVVDEGLFSPDSPVVAESRDWSPNSSVTANNIFGTRILNNRQPWEVDESFGDTTDGLTSGTLDPKDETWMEITRILPPQWEHVAWGSSMYVNSTTIPFVPPDIQYAYRVVKGQSDLGVRKTYERNGDGSQTINFLEYNQGYGIVDSTHIKVFATDLGSGKEFLVVEWNPRNKPLGNVESPYAEEVRKGGVSWTVKAPTDVAEDSDSSRILSVTLNGVPAGTDYDFRVFSGDTDLGTRYVGGPKADNTLTINLKEYNNGQGISSQLITKVLVVDRDIGGRGTLVAARWPSDTGRDVLPPQPERPDPSHSGGDEGKVMSSEADSSQPISVVPSSQQRGVSTPSLLPALSLPLPRSTTRRFFCFTFKRSPSDPEKKLRWWQRFRSRL